VRESLQRHHIFEMQLCSDSLTTALSWAQVAYAINLKKSPSQPIFFLQS